MKKRRKEREGEGEREGGGGRKTERKREGGRREERTRGRKEGREGKNIGCSNLPSRPTLNSALSTVSELLSIFVLCIVGC